MEKILGKGAFVLLHLKIVLVFGKISRRGYEFVADLVPHAQRLVGPGLRGLWNLSLRGETRARSEYGKNQQIDGS